MKFLASLTVILLSLRQSVASPVPADDVLEMRAAETCHPDEAIAFLRAYSGAQADHFYTTSAAEMETAIANDGYNSEGITSLVFSSQVDFTTPLYRLYNVHAADHFYTTSVSERDAAAAQDGYVYEGVAAYIYSSQECGSAPLLRAYSPSGSDHFYTTSVDEMDIATGEDGYVYEGITGFVLPA